MRTKKSMGLAFVLAFLFGPLGAWYANWIAGLVLTGGLWVWASYSIQALPTGTGMAEAVGTFIGVWMIVWVPSLIVSLLVAARNNRLVSEQERLEAETRHQEMLAAIERGEGRG